MHRVFYGIHKVCEGKQVFALENEILSTNIIQRESLSLWIYGFMDICYLLLYEKSTK